MKIHSIKYKITFWYTIVIVIVFSVVIISTSLYSEYYGEDKIKAELQDEVKDLKEDVVRYSQYFPQESLSSYYDDGVVLSIYDSEFNMINGIVPDEFPEDLNFVDAGIKKISSDEENWFVNDARVEMSDGTVIWIRGVHSYSSILLMMQRMSLVLCVILPILTAFTAYVGYRMIRRLLSPINAIVEAANEITSSSQLSRRIQLPKEKDEFYHLTATVNNMLEGLEENFVRERQFSSDAAHELRTPLSVIMSHCEYCLDELKLDEKVTEEIKIIRNKTQQMSDLVTNLLTISRQEKEAFQPDYEEVELQFLAESVVEELEEKAAAKAINMEVFVKIEDTTIMADMSMMTRMFMNIVDNAINYGKKGGYVKIILEDAGDYIRIRFQDNGIGISKKEQKKIWNRFYQADSSHSENSGFGLGLFMVKQIIVAHRGTIEVESEKGEGSTFIVELPRGEE